MSDRTMHNGMILVLPDKPKNFLGKSGMILAPELAKKMPLTGKVVEDSPRPDKNGLFRPSWIGLRVRYPSYCATNQFDEEHIIINESDVWMTEEYVEEKEEVPTEVSIPEENLKISNTQEVSNNGRSSPNSVEGNAAEHDCDPA